MKAGQEVGYFALECFNCGEESPHAEKYDECERVASDAGWVIGLDPDTEHADADFACPDCAVFLIDPLPINVGGAA